MKTILNSHLLLMLPCHPYIYPFMRLLRACKQEGNEISQDSPSTRIRSFLNLTIVDGLSVHIPKAFRKGIPTFWNKATNATRIFIVVWRFNVKSKTPKNTSKSGQQNITAYIDLFDASVHPSSNMVTSKR